MAKMYTFPTLYDECKTLSITKLKEWGYLDGTIKSGTVHWSRNEQRFASIGIEVNFFCKAPYVELNYRCNDKPIKYKVMLTPLPSNIGKGKVWYFVCPQTGKRARKLYMIDTLFLHRSAFKSAMYEKQTYSKNVRMQIMVWNTMFDVDKVYQEIYSRYFKKFYKGKMTKKYKALLEKLRKSETYAGNKQSLFNLLE